MDDSWDNQTDLKDQKKISQKQQKQQIVKAQQRPTGRGSNRQEKKQQQNQNHKLIKQVSKIDQKKQDHQDDDWGVEPNQEQTPKDIVQENNLNPNRWGLSEISASIKKPDVKETQGEQLAADTSNWLDENKQQKQQEGGTRARGRGNRGNRDNNQEQDKTNGQRRVRGNRDNNQEQDKTNGQRRFRGNRGQNNQYRGNRNRESGYNQDNNYSDNRRQGGGGYRGRGGRGRGGYQNSNRMQHQDNNRDDFRNESRQNAGFNKPYYNRNNNNGDQYQRDFRRQKDHNRGQQQENKNNRGNRDNNNRYDNRDRWDNRNNRDYNKDNIEKKNQNNNNQDILGKNIINQGLSNNGKLQPSRRQEIKINPRGRKCWPQARIYIMKTLLTLTYRQIAEHNSDLLVIPYLSLKMNLYPGNILTRSKINYRKKIQQKSELTKLGSVYMQKCQGIPNFKGFAFIRVGNDQKSIPEQQYVKKGIQELFKQANVISQPMSSILIPYTRSLGQSGFIIDTIFEILDKNQKYKYKQVTITSNNGDDFIEAFNAFQKKILTLVQENEICID